MACADRVECLARKIEQYEAELQRGIAPHIPATGKKAWRPFPLTTWAFPVVTTRWARCVWATLFAQVAVNIFLFIPFITPDFRTRK